MLIAATVFAAGLLFGAPGSVAASASCESSLASAGLCSSNNGTSVTVSSDRSTPQSPGRSTGPSNPGGSGSPAAAGPTAEERERAGRATCVVAHLGDGSYCNLRFPADVPTPTTAAAPAAAPAVTITDLASFSPATATATGEPSNLGVAGLPMNFVASASAHVRTGTLFGAPISVRFTPVGFDFRYGDGSTANLSTGGSTWTALGQAQFTPTATSHVYRDRGTYDADVTVRYTAEIDVGAGWMPIDGELSVPGPTQQIRIYEAHTALVEYTCSERPTAKGC